MKRAMVLTYTVQIYVGGEVGKAKQISRAFCDEVGLCVTVEPVAYIYTDGECDGVRVGLINYGRFPSEPRPIFNKAQRLALLLIEGLGQETASIVASDRTMWLSQRPEDCALPPVLDFNCQDIEHQERPLVLPQTTESCCWTRKEIPHDPL